MSENLTRKEFKKLLQTHWMCANCTNASREYCAQCAFYQDLFKQDTRKPKTRRKKRARARLAEDLTSLDFDSVCILNGRIIK